MTGEAACRARIERLNPSINAFLDLTGPADGTGPCYGVKSNIAVAGLPWTAGIGALSGNTAESDATVVRRIRAAGGSILGTLNMHEAALGATTDNPHFGRTQNPWKHGYTPGGSSGGSGAAVAAGLCGVALGSDTMGSVRIPAAYCGVQGHKPTSGLVPNDGVIALSYTYDHVGPLARRVEDLWTSLHVLADWGAPAPFVPKGLSGLRIGVWHGNGEVALTPAVAAGLEAACQRLRDAGVDLVEIIPPQYEYGRSRLAGLLVCEVEGHQVHAERLATDPEGFSESFRKLLAWGARQPAERVEAAYAYLRSIRAAAPSAFDGVDAIIAPTAPQTAFSFDETAPANQADFTAWADFAALPATAVFSGLDAASGLPTSLQVIGPEGSDRETLEIAGALEALFGPPPLPPGFE